ncbi:MAG TPA: hypothetical protein VGW38_28330 [Chloroflexota bacterium]|nr:hypothetical protein [Chloroflexota bacterium]
MLGGHAERASSINAAKSATGPERFANKRPEGYWRLREVFESQQFMIPDG